MTFSMTPEKISGRKSSRARADKALAYEAWLFSRFNSHGARSRQNVTPEYRAWRKLCTSAGVIQKQEACPAQTYTPPVKETVDSPTEYPTDALEESINSTSIPFFSYSRG